MTDEQEGKDRDESGLISFEAYGLKAKYRPVPLDDEHPRSLGEVRDQVRAHLLRLAVMPTLLLTELSEGFVRFVKSLTTPSPKHERTKRTALARVDYEERERQVASEREIGAALPDARANHDRAEQLLLRLEQVFSRIRARGYDASVIVHPDGYILVLVGTQEIARMEIEQLAADLVRRIIDEAQQKSLKE